MLCAFGVVVHAATAARRARDLAALAAGFIVAAIIASPQRLPDPAWVGVVSAGAAVVILFRPRYAMASAAWGGALGGMLTAMTEVQGLHPIAALAVVSVLTATAAWLARVRPSFAPEVLRDEALLGLCLLGLVVAIVPGVTDGWQAAATLTIEPATPGPTTPVPTWTLALVGTATALGAVYSLWSRR
jgi:type III secretory pathway component EscS